MAGRHTLPQPSDPPPRDVFIDAADRWADRLTRFEQRRGRLAFLLLCTAVAFAVLNFVTFPAAVTAWAATGSVWKYEPGFRLSQSYLPIVADPFGLIDPAGGGGVKLWPQFRLRILGPLLARGLGLRGTASALVPWAANVPALFLVSALARGLFGTDRRAALLTLGLTSLLATVHPFVIGQTWLAYQDSLAALFVLAALRFRGWWVGLPCYVLAMLADERAVMAGPLVIAWHALHDGALDDPARRDRGIKLRSLALLAAGGLWLLYAKLMLDHLGLTVAQMGGAAKWNFNSILPHIPQHFWLAFRAAWLLPAAAALLCAVTRGARLGLVGCLAFMLPLVASALFVGDVSRVVGLAFPALLLGAAVVHRHRPAWLPPLLAIALLINVLTPVYTGVGGGFVGLESLPIVLTKRLLGVYVGF